MEQAAKVLEDVEFTSGPYTCATGADAVVLVTEWNAYRALDLARLKEAMAIPIFVDLRNVYRRSEVERHGFTYADVGRGG